MSHFAHLANSAIHHRTRTCTRTCTRIAATMDRIARLHAQLSAPAATSSNSSRSDAPSSSPPPAPSPGSKQPDVYVSRRDVALDAHVYDWVLTADALAFVADLTTTFASDIEKVRLADVCVDIESRA